MFLQHYLTWDMCAPKFQFEFNDNMAIRLLDRSFRVEGLIRFTFNTSGWDAVNCQPHEDRLYYQSLQNSAKIILPYIPCGQERVWANNFQARGSWNWTTFLSWKIQLSTLMTIVFLWLSEKLSCGILGKNRLTFNLWLCLMAKID